MSWKKDTRLSSDESTITTVIASGSKHVGKFSGAGNYVVFGEVEGDCDITGHLTLENGACWNGTIHAEELVISGDAEGDVQAANKITVTDTARVKGNLTGAIIEVAEGAVIQGSVSISSAQDVLDFQNGGRGEAMNPQQQQHDQSRII